MELDGFSIDQNVLTTYCFLTKNQCHQNYFGIWWIDNAILCKKVRSVKTLHLPSYIKVGHKTN